MHALLGRGPLEEWRSRDVMGDCIGSESYIELSETHDCNFGGGAQRWPGRRREIKKRAVMLTRELPPPLPCLVRTDDAHKCRTPWVMRRYYIGDGRLIIRQERGDSHYLRARRSSGRLTINLVPMPTHESVVDITTHKEEPILKDDNDRVPEINEKENNVVVDVGDDGGQGKAAGAGKCYNYETDLRSSRSRLYVLPVPAM